MVIAATLLASIPPHYALMQERATRGRVRGNLHRLHTAIEAYAVDHAGGYPTSSIIGPDTLSFIDEIAPWLPGGDPLDTDTLTRLGEYPVNQYVRMRHNGIHKDEIDLDCRTTLENSDPASTCRAGATKSCVHI